MQSKNIKIDDMQFNTMVPIIWNVTQKMEFYTIILNYLQIFNNQAIYMTFDAKMDSSSLNVI